MICFMTKALASAALALALAGGSAFAETQPTPPRESIEFRTLAFFD